MPKRHFNSLKRKTFSKKSKPEIYAPRQSRLQNGAEQLLSMKSNSNVSSTLDINTPTFPLETCIHSFQDMTDGEELDDDNSVCCIYTDYCDKEDDSHAPVDLTEADEPRVDSQSTSLSGSTESNSLDNHSETPLPLPHPVTILKKCQFSAVLQSPHVLMALELQQLCSDAQIPLHFYEDFLRLFKKYSRLQVNFDKVPSRERLITMLKKEIPCVQPTIVKSPSNKFDVVPKFSLKDQLIDLFASEYFQSLDKCCVNAAPATRFSKYIPCTDEGYSEMVNGQWYRDTYDQRIGIEGAKYTDPRTNTEYSNWLLPLIFYNDKTGVSAMEGSYSLEPFLFTLGIIRRTFRENNDSWRHLGFIPTCSDPKTKSCAEQSLAFNHECLQLLLEDLKELQQNPPLMELELFGETCRVRLILEVAIVMGDQLSQDTHCCRKKINSGGAGRIHRGCFTSYLNAATPKENGCCEMSKSVIDNLTDIINLWEKQCNRDAFVQDFLAKEGIAATQKAKKRVEKSIRTRSSLARDILEKVFSLYPVPNAWNGISFGSNKNGIHRATLDDPMHYNPGGLFMYLAQIAFGGLLPKEQELLEQYMREDASARCSVQYDLPRGKFISGFSNCTLLTASEKVGIMYALYLGLGTTRIADLFKVAILRQQNKYINFQASGESTEATTEVTTEAIPSNPTRKNQRPQTRTPKPTVQKAARKKDNNSSIHGQQPPDLSLYNKVGDHHFFKQPSMGQSCSMDRSFKGIERMVKDLDQQGLLKPIQDLLPHFDALHAEYLLQSVHDRVTSHCQKNTSQDKTKYWEEHQVSSTQQADVSKRIHSIVRQPKKPTKPHSSSKSNSYPPSYNVIQKQIMKHWRKKPTINGLGETSAILTDVQGFRKVLECALIFHAIVHEFHDLPIEYQTNLPCLKKKLDQLMTYILCNIYRGDNSVDVLTCKCHAHFHLTEDIKYFGAPMGFDASKGERNLKFWAKRLSKTARKCGQAIFIQQTANRLSDHLILQRARQHLIVRKPSMKTPLPLGKDSSWIHTRKTAHLQYNLLTKQTTGPESNKGLITEQVHRYLSIRHQDELVIEIWKEIKLTLDNFQGTQYIRAHHEYDSHGPYFDWVHIADENDVPDKNECKYWIAKVVLLYRTTSSAEDFALVWMANDPVESERKLETHVSARWSMEVSTSSRLPVLRSIPMKRIERCIKVQPHFHCRNRDHIPCLRHSTIPGQPPYKYFVDEVYSRQDWAINFLRQDQVLDANTIALCPPQ